MQKKTKERKGWGGGRRGEGKKEEETFQRSTSQLPVPGESSDSLVGQLSGRVLQIQVAGVAQQVLKGQVVWHLGQQLVQRRHLLLCGEDFLLSVKHHLQRRWQTLGSCDFQSAGTLPLRVRQLSMQPFFLLSRVAAFPAFCFRCVCF